jgi:hypothetical protein
MEVVVLTILLDRQVISTNVFSALMMMAIVSTLLATPLTRWFLFKDRRRPRSAKVPQVPETSSGGHGS